MRYRLGAVLAVAAAAISLAAPAAADQAEFLQTLEPLYVYLTPQQLVSAGHSACVATSAGTPSTDVTRALSRQLGISVPAADSIVRTAVVELGC